MKTKKDKKGRSIMNMKYVYNVGVNTDGSYTDIWDNDMIPIDFIYDKPMYDPISEDKVVRDAATWLWKRFNSDAFEKLEEEGIETLDDLITCWAWNVKEIERLICLN